MASLTSIAPLPVESLAPRRQVPRAKEVLRFDESLVQSLAAEGGDRPKTEPQAQPRTADCHDPARLPREARASHTGESPRTHPMTEKAGEASPDRETTDVLSPDEQSQKTDSASQTDKPAHSKTEASDNATVTTSDVNTAELDENDTQNAPVTNAPIGTLASQERQATLQSENKETNPVIHADLNSKTLKPSSPPTDHFAADQMDNKTSSATALIAFGDEAQEKAGQGNDVVTEQTATHEKITEAQSTKPHIVTLSPQARMALLTVNKNINPSTQIETAAEGEDTPQTILHSTLFTNSNLLSTAQPSQSIQNTNEPASNKATATFQNLFDESSKSELASPPLVTSLDQNTPASGILPTSSPLPTAAPPSLPHPDGGRVIYSNMPYAHVPMEIGFAALDGQRSIQVRLSPADLGTIEIELDVSDQSEIHARIAADDPRTLAMLKQDAPLIRQALEQTGLSTNSDSLNFSLRQDGQPNSRQDAEDRSRSPSKSHEQNSFSDQAHDARPTPPPLRRITSLLDLNI